jgi:O-acetyl-ADP-ribose deacetylase (regulator of RNase III)
MLCNIGAAELLMPIGSFPNLREETLTIDRLMQLRSDYEVSVEAILLRAVRLTNAPCTVFVSSRVEKARPEVQYQIDYCIPSRSWAGNQPSGRIDGASVVAECTAIGFTAKGDETWRDIGTIHAECVGIAPYPGRTYPRVAGLVTRRRAASLAITEIQYLRGDATQPRGKGCRIVAHIVNDKTPNWGGGFALVVRRKWPEIQKDFQDWARLESGHFSLGNARLAFVESDLALFSMVSQHGYGPSPRPRVRYSGLEKCLESLARIALEHQASVHMPRIGCGQAGGEWSIVSELIDERLCRRGVDVTVYDLPG